LRGRIKPVEPVTQGRIYDTNTKKVILAEFHVRNGKFVSEGDFIIEIEKQNGSLELTKAALARTARLVMDGNVYVRH
jgi:2-methylaconitate cis-trans-isomerase PrpF